MSIGELNTRVQIKTFSVTQNDEGDIAITPSTNYEKWAKVKQNNGNLLINNGMTSFNESYEITMRYEASRPTHSNYEIDYKDKAMKIYNVAIEKEGNAWFEVVNAYTSN